MYITNLIYTYLSYGCPTIFSNSLLVQGRAKTRGSGPKHCAGLTALNDVEQVEEDNVDKLLSQREGDHAGLQLPL